MKQIFLLISLVVILSACQKKDSELTVSMVPNQASLIDAPLASCSSNITAVETATAPTSDISALRVNYTSFEIRWKKPDTLYIASMQLKFTHPNIQGGEYTCTIAQTDFDYTMTGRPGGSVYNSGLYTVGGVVTPILTSSGCLGTDGKTINTEFTSANATSCHTICDSTFKNCESRLLSTPQYTFDASTSINCSINCGGMNLVDKTKAFVATGKVIIKGYSIGSDLTQTPQKAESTIKFTYEP